jgi:hypothetical protein
VWSMLKQHVNFIFKECISTKIKKERKLAHHTTHSPIYLDSQRLDCKSSYKLYVGAFASKQERIKKYSDIFRSTWGRKMGE